ncbi:MAG: ribosome maturation factor RimM [Clostridiaceae bacterium]|nr:ribosome maturation factor RimM [Clostridiaceae bacterium]
MASIIEWGKIVNTHGVRGELKVMPWVDFIVLAKKVKALDIDGKSYNIVSARGHQGMVLLTLDGVDTMERAKALKDKILTSDRASINLGKGHYFYSDIYGFDVYDLRTKAVIGKLERIESYPGGDVYVVAVETGEVLIPMVEAFDKGADLETRVVTVSTIKGMLEDDED